MNDIRDVVLFYVAPIIFIVSVVIITVCQWIIYSKAGQPGWAAIVPIYATIIRLKVIGKPLSWIFWFIQYYIFNCLYQLDGYIEKINNPFKIHPLAAKLFLISLLIYIIFFIMVINGLSKSFGKNADFTVGLIFLPFIFLPILAFGSTKYMGPGGIPRLTDATE